MGVDGSQVYIYFDSHGYVLCAWCDLNPPGDLSGWHTTSLKDMLRHVCDHREARQSRTGLGGRRVARRLAYRGGVCRMPRERNTAVTNLAGKIVHGVLTPEYTSLNCPLPECDGELYLDWSVSRSLYIGDLDEGQELPNIADAHTSTWVVTCSEGHVLLVPGTLGCPCGDSDGVECPSSHIEGYDWSDDSRTFRRHDVSRLNTLITRLRGDRAEEIRQEPIPHGGIQ
jgi:hypothetical protein